MIVLLSVEAASGFMIVKYLKVPNWPVFSALKWFKFCSWCSQVVLSEGLVREHKTDETKMNYELQEMGQQLVCNSASLQQTTLSIEVDQEVPFCSASTHSSAPGRFIIFSSLLSFCLSLSLYSPWVTFIFSTPSLLLRCACLREWRSLLDLWTVHIAGIASVLEGC